jgi:hypothetical protein
VAVSLSLANYDTTLPVAYRLYLPEEWAKDRQRRHQAKVPETIAFQAKPQIALEQIKAARAAGLLARQGSSCSTWIRVRARPTASRKPAPTRAILVGSVITRVDDAAMPPARPGDERALVVGGLRQGLVEDSAGKPEEVGDRPDRHDPVRRVQPLVGQSRNPVLPGGSRPPQRRLCTVSIHWPDRSARAARYSRRSASRSQSGPFGWRGQQTQ